MSLFVSVNLVFKAKSESYVVPSIKETFTTKFVDFKRNIKPMLVSNAAVLKIDGQPVWSKFCLALEKIFNLIFRKTRKP